MIIGKPGGEGSDLEATGWAIILVTTAPSAVATKCI